MCGIPEAQLALAVVSTVAKHQNAKAVHERNTAANEVSMQNANAAYLADLSKIDNESSRADQAKALAELTLRQETTKKQAMALNSGFGNSLRVIQDIRKELVKRLDFLKSHQKLLEAQRIKERTNYDLELLRETGSCPGRGCRPGLGAPLRPAREPGPCALLGRPPRR